MNLENPCPARDVRAVDGNVSIEAAWPHQCRIKDIWSVGTREDDDVLLSSKPIHLHEQLVEGVLPLVVTPKATAFPSRLSNGIDLVNENNAWSNFSSFCKKLSDTFRTYSDVYFVE